MTNKTRNTANRILAIPAAAPAIPVNPSNAAMSAITSRVIVQLNIFVLQFFARRSAAGVVLSTEKLGHD